MKPLHLFEGFGVEIEYVLAASADLAPLPACDQVLQTVAGEITDEVERGLLCWSNELVLHVVELKTNGPTPALPGCAAVFQEHVEEINRILAERDGRLMPTAMHPSMDPLTQTRLWPHDNSPIYRCFDRIFDCRGHGWANLQSVHLNLPFVGDDEFGRLHAAIRLVLPLLPALAASSPIVAGRMNGTADNRLAFYRDNARRIPSVTGQVIPEPVYTEADYRERILARIYADLAPHDPDGVLRHEWVNARGAIARFTRNTIEIRVLDSQECPAADLALLELIVAVLRNLVAERWSSAATQRDWAIEPLAGILRQTITAAEQAVVENPDYLATFGLTGRSATAGDIWRRLATACRDDLSDEAAALLARQLPAGCLATRIRRAVQARRDIAGVYRDLCGCLQEGRLFGC